MDDFNNIVVIIIIWYSKGVGRLVHLGSWNSVVFVSTFPTRAGRKLIRGIGPVEVTGDSKGGEMFLSGDCKLMHSTEDSSITHQHPE